jgi:hypothetical protein
LESEGEEMKNLWQLNSQGEKYNEETTLTVSELRALLSRYPDNMPVMAQWEGMTIPFRDDSDHVRIEAPEHLAEECREPCLIFDVDTF